MLVVVEHMDENRNRVEAVERAIKVLQCFQKPGEALMLSALAQRCGLYKSTILRLANSLLQTGFLQRGIDGRYTLGPELRRLGQLSLSKVTLGSFVRPVLRQLTDATGETASFYIRDGHERICLFRENSPQSVRHHLEEGTRHPLGVGAAGILLLRYGDGADDPATDTGSIVSRGGRDPDLTAVAVPIVNQSGELVGALTVSGLSARFDDERITSARDLLVRASQSLAPRLPCLEDLDLRMSQN